MIWQAYIQERGSLNLGRRIEVGTGITSFYTARAAGAKVKLSDFMPHENSEPVQQTDDQMLAVFEGMVKNG